MKLIDNLIIVMMTALGVFVDRSIIYLLFIYLCVRKLKKGMVIDDRNLIMIAIYSMIVPDNYLPAIFFCCFFCMLIYQRGSALNKQRLPGVFLLLWGGCAIISTIINDVPIINVVFSVVTFAPLIVFFVIISNIDKFGLIIDNEQFDEILYIELLATIFNYIFFYGTSTDAWSCGTFNDKGGEQAQLLVLMGLFFFVYFDRYRHTPKKKLLLKCMICLLIMCSTFSWALTLVFIFCFTYWLFCGNSRNAYSISKYNKWVILFLMLTFIVGMIQFMPDFIRDSIMKILTDSSYFEYRFYKALLYKITFIDISLDDDIFLLFGNGLGYYCSRAALICSGQYVDFYNNFFSPSISSYTDEYLMNYLTKAHAMGSSDYGSVLARPYSSVLAIMGETGILGITFFLCWYATVVKKWNAYNRVLLLFWIGVCFFENYFEYPKVLLCLLISCIATSRCKDRYIGVNNDK